MKKLLLLYPVIVAAVVAAIALSGASAAAPPAPVVLGFSKHSVGPDLYLGTVDGGGIVEMLILDRSYTDDAQFFSAIVRVNEEDKWFAARMWGSLEYATLETHLRGKVTDGNWLQGAKVLEEGELESFDPLTFTGTLTVQAKHGDD